MKKMYLSPLFVAMFGLTACGGTSSSSTTDAATDGHATHTSTWSYEGWNGPTYWGDLIGHDGNLYPTCGTGTTQSPINLTAADQQALTNITFNYTNNTDTVINNGHTVQVNASDTATSSITVDGKTYKVLQVHFHSPSEHQVDGKLADAEFHIVHQADDDSLAVVGILLNGGASTENAGYASLITQFAQTKGHEYSEVNLTSAIDFNDLLPAAGSRTTYRYTGSLTTPPCSENVKWHVMTTAIDVTDAQITALKEYFDGNNRPVNEIDQHVLIQDTTAAQ